MRPDTSLTGHRFEVSFSPFARLLALQVPVEDDFDSRLEVLDLTTGSTLFEIELPNASSSSSWHFAWSPDSSRLYVAEGNTTTWIFAVDLGTGQVAWQKNVSGGFPFSGYTRPFGLSVDPATKDVFVAMLMTQVPFQDDLLVKSRYAAADGTLSWSYGTNPTGLGIERFEYTMPAELGGDPRFGSRLVTTLVTPSSKFLSVMTNRVGANRYVLVARSDEVAGGLAWARSSTNSFAGDARIIEAKSNRHGSRVHVLAEGVVPGGTGVDALLVTVDPDTATIVGERFLGLSLERVLGLEVLGNGQRLAVAARLADDAGTVALVLDAITGEELYRHERTETDPVLGEAVFGLDGAAYLVGQQSAAGSAVGFVRRESAPTLQDGAAPSVSLGASYPLHLELPAERAGDAYLVAGSSSGTGPLSFGGLSIPLTFDSYLLTTLSNANLAPFRDTLGLLDESGDARARIEWTPGALDASLAGVNLWHAALVYDVQTGAFDFATQAVSTTLQP